MFDYTIGKINPQSFFIDKYRQKFLGQFLGKNNQKWLTKIKSDLNFHEKISGKKPLFYWEILILWAFWVLKGSKVFLPVTFSL